VLERLRSAGGLADRVALPLVATFLGLGDSATALNLLERIEPRSVADWQELSSWYALSANSRFRRMLTDVTPPWAPPEPRIIDLPILATTRARWEGTYAGPEGRLRSVVARGDSLFAASEQRDLGPMLYQGGDTLVASWDHEDRYVFDSSGARPWGFTETVRKRVFPYRRVGR
jgi:hypothetical protein